MFVLAVLHQKFCLGVPTVLVRITNMKNHAFPMPTQPHVLQDVAQTVKYRSWAYELKVYLTYASNWTPERNVELDLEGLFEGQPKTKTHGHTGTRTNCKVEPISNHYQPAKAVE